MSPEDRGELIWSLLFAAAIVASIVFNYSAFIHP